MSHDCVDVATAENSEGITPKKSTVIGAKTEKMVEMTKLKGHNGAKTRWSSQSDTSGCTGGHTGGSAGSLSRPGLQVRLEYPGLIAAAPTEVCFWSRSDGRGPHLSRQQRPLPGTGGAAASPNLASVGSAGPVRAESPVRLLKREAAGCT